MNMHILGRADRLMHHIFHVADLEQSRAFYTTLLDLKFSELDNKQLRDAFPLLQGQQNVFSFRFGCHFIGMISREGRAVERSSMLHLTLVIGSPDEFDAMRRRADEMALVMRKGRMLPSAAPGVRAFCVRDPEEYWIEFVEAV